MDLPAARQTADAVGFQVLAGIDSGDARGLRRGADIDPGDTRIRVRTPQDIGVELAGPVDVVGIGGLSGEEPVILAPANGGADLCHVGYSAAALAPLIAAAPALIASTML